MRLSYHKIVYLVVYYKLFVFEETLFTHALDLFEAWFVHPGHYELVFLISKPHYTA